MRIGPYNLANNLVVAPMAGVTDRPFRQLCRRMGAGLAVSEMLSSSTQTRGTRKSSLRSDHRGEPLPRTVQIAGAAPLLMAEAARYNEANGAQIVDINMGCPAKKVCQAAAGSALLKDEPLVARILHAVVKSVDVPVTLKIRTGWDTHNRNATTVARIAEDAGIQALAIHGRTRACGFGGQAEYETIRQVKDAVRIPVIANGDIRTPQQASRVLAYTSADAIMIGRAAQGRPWIFRQIDYYLERGELLSEPGAVEVRSIVLEHLADLYGFYGEFSGIRIARKHLNWYCQAFPNWSRFRATINAAETAAQQRALTKRFFDQSAEREEIAA